MNEFTIEELEKIADTDHVQCGDASALARMALAAMDSEPVGEFYEDGPLNWYQISEGDKVPDNRRIPLYRHAQPAQTGVDDDVRNIIGLLETNEWAEHCTETVLGSCLEAEITRLVGSSQPAPVVPDEDPRDAFERTFKMPEHVTRCGTGYAGTAYSAWLAHDFVRMWEGWNACRAAMLQAGNHTEQHLDMVDHSGDANKMVAGNSPVIGVDLASGPDRTVEVRYVAPPGYVMVPKEPTEAMINAWLSEVANWRGHVAGYKAALAAAPQQENI